MLACPLFDKMELGYNERRNKLTLVGNDGHLINILVDQQHRLDHLRCHILTVAGLEEVLNALAKEELTILHVAGVASMEEAILVE